MKVASQTFVSAPSKLCIFYRSMVGVSFLRRSYETSLAALMYNKSARSYTPIKTSTKDNFATWDVEDDDNEFQRVLLSTTDLQQAQHIEKLQPSTAYLCTPNLHTADSEDDDLELKRVLALSAEMKQVQDIEMAESRERLSNVVDRHQATVSRVQGDGNCQFRALSVDLYGDQASHAALRQLVVRQLKAFPSRYAPFVQEPYDEYVSRMARNGQWGDNITLQAASDALRCDIRVLTDVPGAESIILHPRQFTEGLVNKPLWSVQKPICLTFITELHYDAAHLDLCPPALVA